VRFGKTRDNARLGTEVLRGGIEVGAGCDPVPLVRCEGSDIVGVVAAILVIVSDL
jgi:hypothetical protein